MIVTAELFWKKRQTNGTNRGGKGLIIYLAGRRAALVAEDGIDNS